MWFFLFKNHDFPTLGDGYDGKVWSLFFASRTADNRTNKKAQLSLTNPRDACEKFAQFT